MDSRDIGEVLAEQVQKIAIEGVESWERVLRLHIKPEPAWLPRFVWVLMVRAVLIQSEERRPAALRAEER